MATIEQNLSEIRSAVYGEDVRNSIANAIEVINNENETLRSSVSASVQNTLENFQPYELVETLPATGKSNKIYALLDLDYIDSDSEDSEESEWSSLQASPYIQVSITPECYENDNANAVKPVMARYYLTNAQVTYTFSGQSYNQTLKTLTFENRELTATNRHGHEQSVTSIVTAISKGLFQQSNNIPSSRNILDNVSLNLTFKEYIYDSDDRLWKYNKNKTVSVSNIKATRKTSSLFEFNISKVNNDIRLNAIVFMQKSDSSLPHTGVLVYYNGYRVDLSNTAYEAIGELCKTAHDQYGYNTASHSTGYVISQKSSTGIAFYGPGEGIGAVGGEPVIWQVAIPSTSTATMYIWSESLQGYIRLTSGS